MTAKQKRAALLLLIAIVLWVTDFIHHINPAIIGFGVVMVALLPRLGVLDVEDVKRMNMLPFIFVAAAVSMANVLTITKGLDAVTGFVFARMLPLMTHPLMATTVLYWAVSSTTFYWRARSRCSDRQFRRS